QWPPRARRRGGGEHFAGAGRGPVAGRLRTGPVDPPPRSPLMERNANYALVGFASLVLFVGLAAFVLWLAQVRFARDYDLYDIVWAGPVRGISVGEITRITLDRENPSQVISRIKVTSDVPIKTDSFATLEPQGVTGVNYVQITAGTRRGPCSRTSPRTARCR